MTRFPNESSRSLAVVTFAFRILVSAFSASISAFRASVSASNASASHIADIDTGACNLVYILHILAYATGSPVLQTNAASTLRGLSGSGASNRAMMASSELVIFQAGDHCFAKMSRQISPVLKWIFGCQSGVLNLIMGGRAG